MASLYEHDDDDDCITFSEFPEDVQLCILSFLTPSDISSFACTSKRFLSLCGTHSRLWYAMCDRRWGSHTHINKWGDGKISFKVLYKFLSEYDRLIGFWRRTGNNGGGNGSAIPACYNNMNSSSSNSLLGSSILGDAPLVFFEWGVSCVTGSRVTPSSDGGCSVVKSPFVWISLSCDGQPLNYLKTPGSGTPGSVFRTDMGIDMDVFNNGNNGVDMDLIRVNVSFMGKGHVVLEESGIGIGNESWNYSGSPNGSGSGSGSGGGGRNYSGSPNWNGNGGRNYGGSPSGSWGRNYGGSPSGSGFRRNGSFGSLNESLDIENVVGVEVGSPPDRVTSEMYKYFANKTSPGAGGERAWRRQRRREKERQGRRRWEPEHLVQIVHCSPTPSRPLQGLWKGICDDMNLDFYLVTYDDIGGVACRRVGDILKPFSGYAPVFWTSNATFIESPLSHEEDYLYNTRMHLRPAAEAEDDIYEHSPSRIMYINSSYDLVLPDLAGTSANPRHVEGRIWQYADGTFGFGFLRDNYIVDLKHIAKNGRLVDTAELYSS